jgi:hypothetical protein
LFCTFKSARDNTVASDWEVVADCFAQYLMTGRIRLNRLDRVNILKDFETGPYRVMNLIKAADPKIIDPYIDKLETALNATMEETLKGLVGKIVGF